MVNITYFIVKEVRNYDCGPWLLYNLAEKSKRYFTKRSIAKNVIWTHMQWLYKDYLHSWIENWVVVHVHARYQIFLELFVINVLVWDANILGTRNTLIQYITVQE